jgi:hypothetical protein
MASALTLTDHTNGSTTLTHDHSKITARPCSARATHHLRTNNPLALQLAFACGTVHHSCTGVSLTKASDADGPMINAGTDGHRVYMYLAREWSGPLSCQSWDDLRKNDLRGLSNMLYLAANDPHPGA